MAPELFHEYKVTKESDVWPFGMTILEVISGQPPFYEVEKDLIVFSRLTNGRLPDRPPELTDQIWTICGTCWDSPTVRVHMSQVVLVLLREFQNLGIDY
ncbi:hypothetical protein M422DRAFT_249048 [Sphaerobolus stellatus SS14]|nr:hypothetical protein M422DRAFT_249048 [Sphaerobolus stellatus SS14]